MGSITAPAAPNIFATGVGITPLPPLDTFDASLSRPTIAIMSMGEMGLGIASLLVKYSYPVITNLDGRSPSTKARAEAAGVKNLPLENLLLQASIFLSILPPGEALALAERTASAMKNVSRDGRQRLVYIDLNAISPSLSRNISIPIQNAGITYLDGCILAYPPKELPDGQWFRPAIPIAGPSFSTTISEPWSSHLTSLLNLNLVSSSIGAASGLKMCFSAINKGLTAISIQAYTTAQSLGVLNSTREYMQQYFPAIHVMAEGSMVASQRKAYRWITEMEEIERCLAEEGGWETGTFAGVADVFRLVKEGEPRFGVEEMVGEVCGKLKARRQSF